jgi:hypothetical protein
VPGQAPVRVTQWSTAERATLTFRQSILSLKCAAKGGRPEEMGIMAQQPLYNAETALLRRLVANPECRFRWTKHAIERMIKRGIVAEDVKCALMNGQIMFHEALKHDLFYRVDGTDLDGHRLQVQVAIYEEIVSIKVITAF